VLGAWWLGVDMGVEGTPVVVGALELTRAVRGVGAPISDFLGVSWVVGTLEERVLVEVDDERRLRAVEAVEARAGFDFRPAARNTCRIAGAGFRRRSGSQTRHFAMKSTNASSSHLRTWAKVLVPGFLLLPLEFTTGLGAPVESKKSFFLELRLIKSLSGTPSTSMMQDNCSCSFSPGKMGKPVYSSARMHPRLHISMAMW